MEVSKWTENWKFLTAMGATVVFLCGTAVGVDTRYAKQVDMKQLQLSSNYNNFQMRLDSLEEACSQKVCSEETLKTINWLKHQIKLLEKEMGMGE